MPEDILFVLTKYGMITIFDERPQVSRQSSSNQARLAAAHQSLGHGAGLSAEERVKQAMECPCDYEITPDYDLIRDNLDKLEAKGWLKLDPSKLNWSPYFLNRSGKRKIERSDPAPTVNGETGVHAADDSVAASTSDSANALAQISLPTPSSNEHSIPSLANATNPAGSSERANHMEDVTTDAAAQPLPPVTVVEPMEVGTPHAAPLLSINGFDSAAATVASSSTTSPRPAPPSPATFAPLPLHLSPPGRPSPRKRASPLSSFKPKRQRLAEEANVQSPPLDREAEEAASLAMIEALTRKDLGLRPKTTPSPTLLHQSTQRLSGMSPPSNGVHLTPIRSTRSGGGAGGPSPSSSSSTGKAKTADLPSFKKLTPNEKTSRRT